MHITTTHQPAPAHSLRAGLPRPVTLGTLNTRPFACGFELDQDRGFVSLLRAFKESGGIGRGDEVADRFKACGREVGLLARWIVERRALSFEWRSELWLPWFQFNPTDMSVKPEFQAVAAELAAGFDGWHLAHWFVDPNCWLNDRRPVDVLPHNPADVLHAARTDRFVVLG